MSGLTEHTPEYSEKLYSYMYKLKNALKNPVLKLRTRMLYNSDAVKH